MEGWFHKYSPVLAVVAEKYTIKEIFKPNLNATGFHNTFCSPGQKSTS